MHKYLFSYKAEKMLWLSKRTHIDEGRTGSFLLGTLSGPFQVFRVTVPCLCCSQMDEEQLDHEGSSTELLLASLGTE